MIGIGRITAWVLAGSIGIVVSSAFGGSLDEPPKVSAESRPISNEEALEFGKELVDAIVRLDDEAVARAVDLDAMLEIASEGVQAPFLYRESFFKGAREAQKRDGPSLLVEFRPAVQAGALVRATKGLEWRGRPVLLLRSINPDMSASYILFMLERDPDGRIRAVDHYSLATGELASQAVRRLYLAGVAQVNRGIVDRLLGKDEALFKHLNDLKRITLAIHEGRGQEALTIYDALPEDLKNEKIFQILRYSAAQQSGDDAKYLEAIQDFARRFPGDPACDFLLIDGYFLTDEPTKALACIDRLENELGEDAYFKMLRGNLLAIMKRPDDALAAYRASIAVEPDLRPTYDGLLNVAVEQKRFGEIAEILDVLESTFNEEIVDLSEIEEFAEFLASPEGKAWTEKREKPTPKDETPRA